MSKLLINTCKKSELSPTVLTGSVGIGKSAFRNYVLRDLLDCNGYREILYFGSEGCVYVFKVKNNEKNVFLMDIDDLKKYSLQLRLKGIEYFVLYDATGGCRTRIESVDSKRTLIFTSTDEEMLTKFDRSNPLHFLMPVWTKTEIDQMCDLLKIRPTKFTKTNLELYGYTSIGQL